MRGNGPRRQSMLEEWEGTMGLLSERTYYRSRKWLKTWSTVSYLLFLEGFAQLVGKGRSEEAALVFCLFVPGHKTMHISLLCLIIK